MGLAAAIIVYEHKKKQQLLQHGEKKATSQKTKSSGKRDTYADSSSNSYRTDINWIVRTAGADA
jgi:hypothetical protein